MPFATRMKPPNTQTVGVHVGFHCLAERAPIFGIKNGIVRRLIRIIDVIEKLANATAFGKALFASSKSFLDDNIIIHAVAIKTLVHRGRIGAAARRTGPCVEDQKPFGMSGRGEGEQQRCGNEGFHSSALGLEPVLTGFVAKPDFKIRAGGSEIPYLGYFPLGGGIGTKRPVFLHRYSHPMGAIPAEKVGIIGSENRGCQGKQQRCGNEGFHGGSLFVNGVT